MSRSCIASRFRRADWFPCALFPFHSPCAPLVFIQVSVPFMSLSVPLCFPFISRCFPVMSTSYFPPHFLALPCISPLLPSIPRKKTRFFQRFRKEDDVDKHGVVQDFRLILGKRRQEAQASKRAGRGNRAWDPSPKFSGTSSNCRAVRTPPLKPTYQTSGGEI